MQIPHPRHAQVQTLRPPHHDARLASYATATVSRGDYGAIYTQQLLNDMPYAVSLHIYDLKTALDLETYFMQPQTSFICMLQGALNIDAQLFSEGAYMLGYFPTGLCPLRLEAGTHMFLDIALPSLLLAPMAWKYFTIFNVHSSMEEGKNVCLLYDSPLNAQVQHLLHDIMQCGLEEDERMIYLPMKIQELFLLYAAAEANEYGYRGSYYFSQEDRKAVLAAGALKLERLDEPLLMKEIASRFNMHPKKMQDGFKLLYGENAEKLTREKRIAKAKQLLKATNKSVEDIALETGYGNGSAFIRAFKRLTGITPAAYRK